MSADTKRYKVTISGESYSLVSDEAEELVMRAARTVDERIAQVVRLMPSADIKKAAVLTALQLASELLVLKTDQEKQSVHHQALADLIEQVIACSSSSACITE